MPESRNRHTCGRWWENAVNSLKLLILLGKVWRRGPGSNRRIKVFDFFSGCGGTSAGLQAAGMQIVLGLDIDPDAAATFRRNFPKAQFVQKNIAKLRPSALSQYIDQHRSGPILFLWLRALSAVLEAKWQPYSKRFEDSSAQAFWQIRSLLLPRLYSCGECPWAAETVSEPGPLPGFLKLLDRLGYNVTSETIECRDYGVPQKRSRFVLLASAKNGHQTATKDSRSRCTTHRILCGQGTGFRTFLLSKLVRSARQYQIIVRLISRRSISSALKRLLREARDVIGQRSWS